MVSRPKGGGSATRIQLKGGERTFVGESGGPEGTSVVVRDLFFNTPARRKYLKSVSTEIGHVYDVVSSLAISHPEISFLLYREDRLVLSTDGTGDYLGAVTGIYGNSLAKGLVPVSLGLADISIFALIGKPDLARSGREGLKFFVNGRPIQSRTIIAAIEKAFGGAVPRGRHPVAFVWISVDPASVDVNVHPAKREVRFAREGDLYRITFEAAKQALRQKPTMVTLEVEGGTCPPERTAADLTDRAAQDRATARDYGAIKEHLAVRRREIARDSTTALGMLLAESFDSGFEGSSGRVPGAGTPSPAPMSIDIAAPAGIMSPGPDATPGHPVPAGHQVSVIGQYSDTYILVQGPGNLYIVDQHAAHERVLYERIVDSFDHDSASCQMLLVPVILELEPRLAHEVEGKRYLFERIGFELEPFGQNAFLVRSVPALLAERPGAEIEGMLREAIGHAAGEDGPGNVRLDLHGLAATIACRLAVKAGDRMHHEEMKRLVSDLLSTRDPLLCPHGRPTMISLPLDELERRFRRPAGKGRGSE
ncbi:MAG TPA: hypothetical protein GX506_07835 [Firmicutes bacterium]|nr:hypothetical protein [Bacillota bacterium]